MLAAGVAQRRICPLCGRAFAIFLPLDAPERKGDRLYPERAARRAPA